MKRLIPGLVLVLALAAAVWASNPAQLITTYALMFTGSSGEVRAVTPADPLPVTVTSGASSVSQVAPQGATSVAGTFTTITSTPSSWTLTASATDFAIWNVGSNTVWMDFNGTGATVSAGLPLTASGTISRDAAQGVVVWLVASTPTAIYRAEGRR